MLRLQHLLPDNYPSIIPGNPKELNELMPYLHSKISRAWTAIPNSELETYFQIRSDVPVLGFRKHGQEIYIHIFCFESYNLAITLSVVNRLYLKHKLGIPATPQRPNWIHTIPLPGPKLSQEEVMFIHQITQSMFWTVYVDFKKSRKNILGN